eukprot:TRINITY_DN5749_c0_g3_i1.p1 TRINITY_DN5749_c0_g3~~TRINITY_DN5749_c0_g3_i1.p1  ORF type:complete len:113 (+),score=17.16 TRINITY_DN5749_c0_g3_i1:128-466(+)
MPRRSSFADPCPNMNNRLVSEAVKNISAGDYSLRQLHTAITSELEKVPDYKYVLYNTAYGGYGYSKDFEQFRKTSPPATALEAITKFGEELAAQDPEGFRAFIASPDAELER